ncbi:hypothetical protein [Streptomyces sp. NPDC001985]|uniref:hypothetical protein n=1 Tax=Streptomyces sp. NPDC001985 TaxID=3154406 RepID=UPI00332F8691
MIGTLRSSAFWLAVTIVSLTVATVLRGDSDWLPVALWILWPLVAVLAVAIAVLHRAGAE